MASDSLKTAIELIKAGKKGEAQLLLEPLLQSNPRNVNAWFWYVETWPTVQQRIKALELCLQHNSDNEQARHALQTLRSRQSAIIPASKPQTSIAKPVAIHNEEPVKATRRPAQGKPLSWIYIAGVVALVVFCGALALGTRLWVSQNGNPLFAPSGAMQNPSSVAGIPATMTPTPPATTLPIPTRTPKPFTGKWQSNFGTSEFDDTRTVVLSLKAENSVEGWLTAYTPVLILRCKERETDAYVIVGMQVAVEYGMTDSATVRVRFDKEEAQTMIANESTDGEALFFRDPIEMSTSMLSHDEMVYGFTPFNASPVVATFDLRGLAGVMEPLQETCGWGSTASIQPATTRRPAGTNTPAPTPTLFPTPIPSATPLPVGSYIVIENWRIQVERIVTVQSTSFGDSVEKAAGRFALVFMSVTNLGLSPDTFVAFGTVEIQDASGRRHEENIVASGHAMFQYDTDIGAEINPDAAKHVVAAFDISKESEYYLLVPGSLAPQNGVSLLLGVPK